MPPSWGRFPAEDESAFPFSRGVLPAPRPPRRVRGGAFPPVTEKLRGKFPDVKLGLLDRRGALALWLGYALGTLFRRGEDAGRMLESWKTEVYDPTEEYLAHLRFGGTAFMIVGALTALAALLD